VNNFTEIVNEFSPYFWGGKFFLTAVIIYIVFIFE
jgi:hypothetical protein